MKPARNPRYLRGSGPSRARCAARPAMWKRHIPGHAGSARSRRTLRRFPLCTWHHRIGHDAYHKLGPRKFAQVHHVNIPAIVTRLSTKPFIRVEAGAFVGRLGDREYELGSTKGGLARAVRRMSGLRREILAEVA